MKHTDPSFRNSNAPLIGCTLRVSPRPVAPDSSDGLSPVVSAGWHSHDTGQLIWPLEGIITQHTAQGTWVTPSIGATWVPPGIRHVGRFAADNLRLAFHAQLSEQLPRKSCIIAVTPRLADAFASALEISQGRRSLEGLVPAFLAEVKDSELSGLEDPFPDGAESSFLVRHVLQSGEMPGTWTEWCRLADRDSVELRHELLLATGMTANEWQRQVRLLRGVRYLAEGFGVAEAGRRAGYESVSRFIHVFKRATGVTPGEYFELLFERARGGPRSGSRLRTVAEEARRRIREKATQAPQSVEKITSVNSPRPPSEVTPSCPDAPRAVEIVGCDARGPLSQAIEARITFYKPGRFNGSHSDRRGKFVWPMAAMTVGTEHGTYVGHSGLALWIPPRCKHETYIWGPVRHYKIQPELAARLPSEPCAVLIGSMLGKALRELLPAREPRSREAAAEHFLEMFREAELPSLSIPMFLPGKLTVMLDVLRVDPAHAWTQDDWARQLGFSRRTLIRLCEKELGLPFSHLRSLMQVRRSVELLAVGKEVRATAHEVGYQNVSKFIAMFRGIVGMTPGKYFRASGGRLTRGK